jgi:hypothetical protein
MSVSQSLFGTIYPLPENKEKKWGSSIRSIIIAMATALDALATSAGFPVLNTTTTSLAAGSTLTRTHARHRIAGNGSAVTLSDTTAIAAGVTTGETLALMGTSDTNTVTIKDSAGTKMNGAWVAGLGDWLTLTWDSTLALWVESGRNS